VTEVRYVASGREGTPEFAGRVALITGASRGLGRATALMLAARGADLVLTARGLEQLEVVAASARALGSTVLVCSSDVGVPADREELVANAIDTFGHVDCLVANATNQDIYVDRLPATTKWEGHFTVDVLGAVRLADLLLPGMRERGLGAIVFVSSVSGKSGYSGIAGAGYGAMKAALIAAAKMYGYTAAHDGVRVNAVAPGTFFEEGSVIWGLEEDLERTKAEIASSIPLGRLGRPEEIAEAVCFLLSDRASFIASECLVVDGGQYPGIA
jgi:3-oxoacyl-[acyl-carrier protein] reductase